MNARRSRREATGRQLGLIVALLLSGPCLQGCTAPHPAPDATSTDYVRAALNIMKDHGLYGSSVEFRSLESKFSDGSVRLTSTNATYAFLQKAVEAAGGDHSFFLPPVDSRSASEQASQTDQLPDVSVVDQVATVTLPPLPWDPDTTQADQYVSSGRSRIEATAAETGCGWVVDLRNNSGGNAISMLETLTPMLSDDARVGFQFPDGHTEWLDLHGRLSNMSSKPVAIVTSPITASAAELVALAFEGQKLTARIGLPTAGLVTSNQTFSLSDGASLVLSVARFVDRDGDTQVGSLEPDIDVPYGSQHTALAAAQEWVHSQCNKS